ncbi:protein translocase subunit SecD [Flexilinea flocculi]|uniref:Protein translocase subunit SecD n=1 Tax=Flexilinea flocculi TaxID=1678840 RepID=A0A0S7BWJ7_9CHLR|nr:protein translocase subunit SecD [Flexilinea flocculi]GAP40687.1 protein-export membrane protein, SecD/SecF family [Flexilinea flocculi]
MKKPFVNLIIIILIFLCALFVDVSHENGLRIGSLQRSGNLYLGLDLQGGMQVLLEADVEDGTVVSADQLNTARQILENRSNGLGVSDVVFQVAGSNRILAEFPGMTNTEEVLATLKGTGLLEFVDTGDEFMMEGDPIKTDLTVSSSEKSSETTTTAAATAANLTDSSDSSDSTETATEEKVYHTVLTGAALQNVSVQMENSTPVVAFELKSDASQTFADFTSANIGKYLTIVLDGKVISSPRINGAITGGSGVITGNFTIDSANALSVQLKYGALPVPLKIVEYKMIGATLGEDSLKKSLVAGLIGLALAALFMILYYRLAGAVAVLAIIFYGAVSLALYKLIPITLSLSGIAGFILTTGGAFDANILMFERLKEELRNGKTINQAITLCWTRAWSSIRDSNVATLITAAILFYFGSSFGATIVKGFAVSLCLGVLISMFTAFLVTRTLLHYTTKVVKPENQNKWFGV